MSPSICLEIVWSNLFWFKRTSSKRILIRGITLTTTITSHSLQRRQITQYNVHISVTDEVLVPERVIIIYFLHRKKKISAGKMIWKQKLSFPLCCSLTNASQYLFLRVSPYVCVLHRRNHIEQPWKIQQNNLKHQRRQTSSHLLLTHSFLWMGNSSISNLGSYIYILWCLNDSYVPKFLDLVQ